MTSCVSYGWTNFGLWTGPTLIVKLCVVRLTHVFTKLLVVAVKTLHCDNVDGSNQISFRIWYDYGGRWTRHGHWWFRSVGAYVSFSRDILAIIPRRQLQNYLTPHPRTLRSWICGQRVDVVVLQGKVRSYKSVPKHFFQNNCLQDWIDGVLRWTDRATTFLLSWTAYSAATICFHWGWICCCAIIMRCRQCICYLKSSYDATNRLDEIVMRIYWRS